MNPWARLAIPSALIVLFVFLAYLPALHGGFIWDDDAHLTANPCIVGPLGFREIWTSSAATYYPLVLSSFWVQHAIWGLNPLPYHLVNIAMHAACAVLLWLVLRCLKVRGAWFGAALWGLHPVQTESVAWITELKNTQSCLFYLLAIWFFLKWRTAGTFAGRKGTEWDYALALLCAVLAILSKASTVMLPVVLGLVWWWSDGRWCWRNIFRLVPFFIISAAASGWTIWEQQFHSGAVGPEWSQSRPERLVIAGKAVWFYLGKLLWPHPLIFIYPRWGIDASRPTAYLPVLALGVTLFLLWLNRRGRTGPVFFAFACFVVSLFPMLGFFNVYFFRYSFVGDHFQYLASLGPLALAAAVITTALDLFKKRRPFLEPVFCGMLLLVLGALTWQQCGTFADMETLWRKTLARNPDCWMAHNNLGLLLNNQGRIEEAMEHYHKAIQINPNSFEALNNLGNAFTAKGRVDEAIENFRKAIQINPNYADALNNLGAALAAKGRVDEAIENFRKALQLNPNSFEALDNLGAALATKGRFDEAIENYRRAIQINPNYADALNNLGVALATKGRFDEAIENYYKALQINPNYADALNNLGVALAAQGRVDEAIENYYKAIQINPNYADALNNLGVALANKGRLDEAIENFLKAIQIDPNSADALNNLGFSLAAKGRLDEAIENYYKAIQINSNRPETFYHLGMALGQLGRTREAVAQYREALRLNPNLAGALNNLAWALAASPDDELRNGAEAVRLAERACELTHYGQSLFIGTLAAAYAEAGRFPEAVATAEKAEQLATTAGSKKPAGENRQRLELYRAGKPYHDPAPMAQ
jgi:tetratricopeptide (TPR) repeat protein